MYTLVCSPHFQLRIPDFAYFTLNYSVHSEIVDLSTVDSEVDEFFKYTAFFLPENISFQFPIPKCRDEYCPDGANPGDGLDEDEALLVF